MEQHTASGRTPEPTAHPESMEGYELVGSFSLQELPLELQVNLLKGIVIDLLRERENASAPAEEIEDIESADAKEADDDSYRIDSQTQERIHSGWVFDDGADYIGDENRAEALCQKQWGLTIEQAYEQDLVYWTQWD